MRPRRTKIATRRITIGITRYLPYRLGSLKSDVTRKKDVYAFATSRSRAKKSVRVCACQIPTAAKSVPSATSVTRRARGSQSATGARATTASPATNGKTKKASAIAPARSSKVHRNDVALSVTNVRQRQRQEERRRRRALAAEDPVREREHGRRDDEVEREEQERLLASELDRNAKRRDREQCDRRDGRVADEQHGTDEREHGADDEKGRSLRLRHEKPQVVVADEGPG